MNVKLLFDEYRCVQVRLDSALSTLRDMSTCYLIINSHEITANAVVSLGFSMPVEFVDQGLKIVITEDHSLTSQYQACDYFINHNLASCVLLSNQVPENRCRLVFSPDSDESPAVPRRLNQIINQIGFNIETFEFAN